ncbi:BatA domain-containing protein [Salegentibacter chungangensis]|uniref:BatA domain-containing protein n=1 Tax=Salegentibacter chungangensis TaxID=1335724 RepID=A0ABW3NRX5_9FLAO
MQFLHPELLYALFLLLIPILVHLFRLRKFQKEYFTNVKFLKKISSETRKSSQLKKWLILISRLLMLTAIIIAFAQPYLPAQGSNAAVTRKLIYLDNSQSMQLRGPKGELLASSVQSLLENIPENDKLSLITNDKEYFNLSTSELRKELSELDYSPGSLNFEEIKLKAGNYFKNKNSAKNELILISDFQQNINVPTQQDSSAINISFIPLKPVKPENISIDSAFVQNKNTEGIEIKLLLKSNTEIEDPVSVSLYNNEDLLTKNTADFNEENEAETIFNLKREALSNAYFEIEDNGLIYDNLLYFSLNQNPQIQVSVISDSSADFLQRIFTEPEFSFHNFSLQQLDYKVLSSSNLIVLNEIPEINSALSQNLKQFYKNGTVICLIPAQKAQPNSYNLFLKELNAPVYGEETEREQLITGISFEHPLFNSVFEKQISNFDYPKVQSFYRVSRNQNAALSLQDGSPFLLQRDQLFMFAAALNSENSNFKQSPLIVPSFYNMGLAALKSPKLYYQINDRDQIDIPVSIGQDEVLSLKSEESSVIPQQQLFPDKVQIFTNAIETPGNYRVMYGKSDLGKLSFNEKRTESKLVYTHPESLKNIRNFESIDKYFENAKASGQTKPLWKWFVIFALFFMSLEMLLLKFFK